MLRKLVFLCSALLATAAFADAQAEQNVRQQMGILMPGITIDSVQETPVPGLYQVASGTNVIYMTEDGNHIIQGDLYSVENGELSNVTDVQRQTATKKIIDAVDPETMIIYPAENEKTYVTIITDIDCTYCRALHKEVPQLNAAGITVRYMAFPRTPPGTESYQKMISVWCNPDRNWALSDAKKGNTPTKLNCKHPIDDHVKIVRELGVNVTPVIIMKNGRMVPGYLPAQQLIEAVESYGG
jgi:thiol:disulfide interchange protein DsbC